MSVRSKERALGCEEVVKKEGGVVRIEGGGVKKCKSVVKTLKTVVKMYCIIPFTPSDPAWPALASVSLTVFAGQKDRCLILPNSAQFVSEGEDLGGAQGEDLGGAQRLSWRSTSAAGPRGRRLASSRPALLTGSTGHGLRF